MSENQTPTNPDDLTALAASHLAEASRLLGRELDFGAYQEQAKRVASALGVAPSSVQGDTTPATPDDDAARHMADVTRHPRFAELYAQAAHNVRARDNHDQGDDTAPSSVQGDTTPGEGDQS